MLATAEYDQVTQIKLCRYPDFNPNSTVSAYMVDSLLIDSGPAHTAEELTEFLQDKGLTTVVNTHHHEDHIAANALLKERYGVELFAHRLAVNKINQPATLYRFQEEVWGYPIPSQVKEIGNSISTNNFRFEVIPTPGHDRDHICLFEPKRGWIFTGDLFVGTRPNVARPVYDVRQIITDLKKVRDLEPQILFPASSEVRTKPVPVLKQTIEYLEELDQRVMALNGSGLSPAEIVKQIFGYEEAPLAQLTEQEFSSLTMVKSLLKTS